MISHDGSNSAHAVHQLVERLAEQHNQYGKRHQHQPDGGEDVDVRSEAFRSAQGFARVAVSSRQRGDCTTCVVGHGKAQEPTAHRRTRHGPRAQLRHHRKSDGGEEQLSRGVQHVQEDQRQQWNHGVVVHELQTDQRDEEAQSELQNAQGELDRNARVLPDFVQFHPSC
jgi:hypothetical protein